MKAPSIAAAVAAAVLASPWCALGQDASFEGVAGYVEGRARAELREVLNREGGAWMQEAFRHAFERRGGGSASSVSPELIARDAQIRAEVQAELKGRLAEWFPREAERIVAQDILGGAEEQRAREEAQAIAARAAGAIADGLLGIADAIVAEWYDAAVRHIQNEVLGATLGLVDVTDVRGSIDRAFDLGTMGDIAADQLGRVVGDATVQGIRGRIEDALRGQLPPEAIDALQRGPREFEKYVSRIEEHLPGAEFKRLTDSVLNRPIIKLPSAAYAAILAASAAGHFARAFKGVTVDPVELRRGVEVTRVMVWQLENRQWINLSVMQLSGLARGIARRFGAGAQFEKVAARLREPLDRIQKLADRVDQLVKKPIETVRGELENLTGILEDELRAIQDRLVGPLREGIDRIQDRLDAAGEAVADLLPEKFNGIPPTWAKAREAMGIEGKRKGDPPRVPPGPTAAIVAGEEVPARDASESDDLDPVLLHNGEFIHRVTDLVIPGRGLDFRFTRIYRGRSDFLGELGHRWTHSYAERLLPWDDGSGDGLTHIDEQGLKFFFRREGEGYRSPPGVDAELARLPDGTHELSRREGLITAFDAAGRLIEKRDRYGNRLRFAYDEQGLLSEVVDVYGRKIVLERNPDGLLIRLRDFAGRMFQYDYNDRQELIGATAPATPDFPKGKTTAYRYAPPDARGGPAHAIAMIMDPNGRVYLRNRYDDEGRVWAQRYGNGPWVMVAYGQAMGGDVASRAWVTDALGAVRLFEHDARGHLLRRWRFDDGRYRLLESHQYNEGGERIRSCLPSGHCWSFGYEEGAASGEVVRIEEWPAGGGEPRVTTIAREGHSGRKQFNAFGQLIEEVGGRGAIVRYEYYPVSDPDGDGVPIRGIEDDTPAGYLKRIVEGAAATTFSYDPIGNVTAVTDRTGRTTRYRVNALNEVVREERAGSAPIAYRFDANDNLVGAEIDEGGRRIRHAFAYGALDRLVSERWQIAPGRFAETQYSYDAAGRLDAAVDPDGRKASFFYDDEDLLRCVVRGSIPGPVVQECVERDIDGDIVAFIDGEGSRTVFVRDGFGEVVARVDPLGNRIDIEHDTAQESALIRQFTLAGAPRSAGASVGDPFADSWAANLPHSARQRNNGGRLRPSQPTRRDGLPAGRQGPPPTPGYSPNEGRPPASFIAGSGSAASRSPPEAGMTIERDDLGRPIAVIHGRGDERAQTRYDWTDGGRLRAFTGPDGATTEFFYDGLGRLVLERFADGTERRTSYDGRDRVLASIDRNGGRLSMEYDAAGRLVLRRAAPADGVVGTRLQRFGYDGLGRLIFAADENDPQDPADDAVSRFAYDSLSRPIAEAAGDVWLRREFDDAGNEAVIAFPSGVALYSAFDRDGRPASAMTTGARIVDTARDAAGRVQGGALGNFISFWIERDPEGRPSSHQYAGRGESWRLSVDVERDDAGRVLLETRDGWLLRSNRRDGLGRLALAEEGIADPDSHEGERMERVLTRWRYAYDAAGNVQPLSDDGTASQARLAFDAAGNITSDGQRGYRYDPFGRLTEVWAGGRRIARYRYDAFDRRVVEETPSGIRRSLWDGWRLAASWDRDGIETDYAYGADIGPPIAAISGGRRSFLLSDRMGSVIGWASEAGDLLAQCAYDPFGQPIDVPSEMDEEGGSPRTQGSCHDIPPPFRFAGHIFDRETGLVYMRHRYYDPALGRFLTPDPLGFKVSMRAPAAALVAPFLSYHAGQGGASRATFPDRPLLVSAAYDLFPFGRIFPEAPAPFREGEPNLSQYARSDPATYADPLGLASLLFDRSEERLFLLAGDGYVYHAFHASNRSVRPNADPLQVGGRGPFPNGTYSIGIPEFYSEDYRDYIIDLYELEFSEFDGSPTNGRAWARAPKTGSYHQAFGRIRLRAGSDATEADRVAYGRQLFLHGGRKNYRARTLGCIRVDDRDLMLLAVEFARLRDGGDPITTLTVQD